MFWRGRRVSEAGEEVVEHWLNVVKGFFTIKGLKVGNREIDFLAVKLDGEDPILGSRAHVEVHVAAYSRAIGKPYWPPSGQAEQLCKKFYEKHVEDEIVKRLGEDYRRVLVLGSYGRYKPDSVARAELIEELEKRGITVVKFEEVLKEVEASITESFYTRPALRMIQYYKYMREW